MRLGLLCFNYSSCQKKKITLILMAEQQTEVPLWVLGAGRGGRVRRRRRERWSQGAGSCGTSHTDPNQPDPTHPHGELLTPTWSHVSGQAIPLLPAQAEGGVDRWWFCAELCRIGWAVGLGQAGGKVQGWGNANLHWALLYGACVEPQTPS